MPEHLSNSPNLRHPSELKNVFGKVNDLTRHRFNIEQTPGFETHFIPYRPFELYDRQQRLAIEVGGAADGRTIITIPGMPGSRIRPKPNLNNLKDKGIRLVSLDLPGYGFSDPLAVYGPSNTPRLIKEILNYLEFDYTNSIDIIGGSGGGPHALACSTLDVVNSVVVMASLAPRWAFGLDWYDGMCDSNKNIFSALLDLDTANKKAAWDLRQEIKYHLEQLTEDMRQRPTAIYDDEHGEDGHKKEDLSHKMVGALALQAALRSGLHPWLQQILSCNDWGFDPSDIGEYREQNRKPNLLICSTADDVFAPPQHSVYLQKATRGEHAILEGSHFSIIEAQEQALDWCMEKFGSLNEKCTA